MMLARVVSLWVLAVGFAHVIPARQAPAITPLAVTTVDSLLLNGGKENFPGTIIMVIDESSGGDAIVARKDKLASLEDLKTKSGYKIAFTAGSPSEHLLKSIAVHFDVPPLRNRQGGWSTKRRSGMSKCRPQVNTK